ncbi:MAG: hypothetical protein IPK19_30925 [Chloroflexi bacterium]|nr:hypothetical protein [Chloroflexota bacterium]
MTTGAEIEEAASDLPVIVVGIENVSAIDGVFFVARGQQPDAAFRDRYLTENAFAPEPGALARAVYEAAAAAIAGARTGSRAGAANYLSEHLE